MDKRDQLSAAASSYEQRLRTNPNDVQALYRLGMLEEQKGAFERAADLYRRTIANLSSNVEPDVRAACHVALGNALFGLTRWSDAEPEFRRALHLDPRHA